MLQYLPIEPLGQESSIPLRTVHFCEHTAWPSMSIVPVQTWLSHSVEVSLGVTHVAPNVRAAGPLPASGAGAGALLEQATNANDRARRRRCMSRQITMQPREILDG